MKLRGTRRVTDWAEVSATASGSAGDQPDATRMLLLLDLAEACRRMDAMDACGVRVGPVAGGCGWWQMVCSTRCAGGRASFEGSQRLMMIRMRQQDCGGAGQR